MIIIFLFVYIVFERSKKESKKGNQSVKDIFKRIEFNI